MSYLLDYKGVKITAESADEAVELARKLAGDRIEQRQRRTNRNTLVEVTPNSKFMSLWRQIEPESKQVLTTIAKNPSGIITDQLAGSAGVKSENIKYILRKIHSKAHKCGLDPAAVISSEKVYIDRQPKSRYRMSESISTIVQSIIEAKQ